jgi:hypothetical protein
MVSKDTTYSNRQVKGTENLFGPDDPDAFLVGGTNQPSFTSGANIVINNATDGVAAYVGDNENQSESEEEEEVVSSEQAGDLPSEPKLLGTVTKVTFTQINKFTPNGTFLADVVANIEEVEGATDYEINYFRIS